MIYKNIIKSSLDIFVAVIGLIILSPLMVSIGLVLRFNLKGSPFFYQKRNGFMGKEFEVIKFRTMTNEKGPDGELLSNDKRLTKIGGLIRRTSLDELPQLINVLKGQMSIIGPRPLPLKYFHYFEGREKKRFEAKPGITGLAQVSGRNILEWGRRIELDVQYVEKICFTLDTKILLLTIKKVLKRDDNVVDPTVVMLDFDEYKKQKSRNA